MRDISEGIGIDVAVERQFADIQSTAALQPTPTDIDPGVYTRKDILIAAGWKPGGGTAGGWAVAGNGADAGAWAATSWG